ncbi:hypothetical protein [Acaryochloris thomasi]|nr:hypothetical protein [Acaryochloris thomasi]
MVTHFSLRLPKAGLRHRMITDLDVDEALSAWQEYQGLRSQI